MTKRRLFFDIEVSFNICAVWSVGHKISVGYENIIKERAIICICYKWEGEKKVSWLTWDKDQNDKTMLEKFIKVANTADEIVGHNSDKFDIKWIRTRCLLHRVPMLPSYQSIDTLKAARNGFRFNSNRLDYISQFLGGTGKIKTSYDWWLKITLENCKKSLAKMVRYCKKDVIELERIHKHLNAYLPAKTHYGVKAGKSKKSCPECGSNKTQVCRSRVSAAGVKQKQLQCQDCGKYHTISEKEWMKNKT